MLTEPIADRLASWQVSSRNKGSQGVAKIAPPQLQQEQRQQAAEAAAMKKDPDAYRAKMEAMESARLRMQEQYNQVFQRLKINSKLNGFKIQQIVSTQPFQAAEAEQLKREQAEALKREQDIKDWEEHQRGGGYKNRAPAKVDKEREALEQQAKLKGKKGFKAPPPRTDFNPLMGGGGGAGYRPPARRGGGG